MEKVIKDLPVLAVDDEESIIRLYKHVLKDYNLLLAQSAEQALDVFKQHTDTAVVITDIVMEEETSGIDLIEQIEALNPVTQFIIISGLHGKNSIALQTVKGSVSSLPKPVEVAHLEMAVRAAYIRYFDYCLLYDILSAIAKYPKVF